MLFDGREVRKKKNCASVYVRTSASDLGSYARPRAQFFSIRTSRPANNIYIFMKKHLILFTKFKGKKQNPNDLHKKVKSEPEMWFFWAVVVRVVIA